MSFDLLLHISSAASSLLAVLIGQEESEKRLAAKRRRKGLCETCGYDVRGSPGLRCPECNGLIRVVGRERF